MFKVALIGVSGFGVTHYNDLMRYSRLGKLQIVAATIINQDEEIEKCAALRAMNCRLYTDYQKMFDDFQGKLDLCFIPVGIALHAPMAIAAMRSGASAMIEKPAAATIQEVNAMQEVEKATGRFTAVGFQSIYQPEIQRIKREILAGKIGKIRSIKGLGLWPRDSQYYSRNNWAGKLRNNSWILDSPFNNALAHYLNLLCFFAGKTFEESAEINSVKAGLFRCNPEIETTDCAAISLECKAGFDILFFTAHCSENHFGPELTISGDKGSIIWSPQRTIFEYSDHREEIPSTSDAESIRNNMMDALLDRLINPDAFICGLDIAGTHVLAVNGSHESAQIIPIPSDMVKKLTLDNNSYRYIWQGMDELFHKLYAEERLPNASDCPMKIGEKFFMDNYQNFDGGKISVQRREL